MACSRYDSPAKQVFSALRRASWECRRLGWCISTDARPCGKPWQCWKFHAKIGHDISRGMWWLSNAFGVYPWSDTPMLSQWKQRQLGTQAARSPTAVESAGAKGVGRSSQRQKAPLPQSLQRLYATRAQTMPSSKIKVLGTGSKTLQMDGSQEGVAPNHPIYPIQCQTCWNPVDLGYPTKSWEIPISPWSFCTRWCPPCVGL